jgi:hypothetical protein
MAPPSGGITSIPGSPVPSSPGGSTSSPDNVPSGGAITNPIPGVFDTQYSPAAPGNYPEQVSGSYTLNGKSVNVSSTGVLTVRPASASGMQVWAETSGQNQPTDSLAVVFDQQGASLHTETLGLTASTLTCIFSPPVPILPTHPVFGSTFRAGASCGNFSADVNGVVQGTKTITLAGVNYATLAVRTTIVTKGTTPATIVETDWVSPALRFVLRSTQTTTTTYDGFPYQITTITAVTSLPAPA